MKHRARIDFERLHRHFLQRLRESEESDPRWVRGTHREWAPRLREFARHIEVSEPLGDDASLQDLAATALDAAIQRSSPEVPLVARLESERIAAEFHWERYDVEMYALETKLTRRGPDGSLAVTGLGRTFLRLRGKDAVRWLLTAENLQSHGDGDRWRASRHLLEIAVENQVLPLTNWDDSEYFPFDSNTLTRLVQLGALDAHVTGPEDDAEVRWYFVPEAMTNVVRSVLDEGPWHSAVTALLEDERSFAVLGGSPIAVEATIEQTRMIAHEVRNALGPVRYNVDELLSEELTQNHRSRVEAAKKGVLRVLDFVDHMVATSELITEPVTAFDVEGLLREALGWIDDAGAAELILPTGPVRLRGPRPLLLRALLDIIRNALQSATPTPPVRISAERDAREVRIVVEDGGPGVPAELRARVFDDGFTTRPGGSGFGLAFLRKVVEHELGGRVSCEDADLGGARFTIIIPDAESEP